MDPTNWYLCIVVCLVTSIYCPLWCIKYFPTHLLLWPSRQLCNKRLVYQWSCKTLNHIPKVTGNKWHLELKTKSSETVSGVLLTTIFLIEILSSSFIEIHLIHYISLRCTICWFDTVMYCETITTIVLTNPSVNHIIGISFLWKEHWRSTC